MPLKGNRRGLSTNAPTVMALLPRFLAHDRNRVPDDRPSARGQAAIDEGPALGSITHKRARSRTETAQ